MSNRDGKHRKNHYRIGQLCPRCGKSKLVQCECKRCKARGKTKTGALLCKTCNWSNF